MIELKDITKTIEDNVLFKNLNFTFRIGGFNIITGPSGCGKSTLLNIIGGLDINHSGSVIINNNRTTSGKRRKMFDYLFQNYGLVDSETIKYNLKLVKKKEESIYVELLKIVNLDAKLNQYVYTLSGGEQQRLALARTLLSNRDYILADEPTASLDIDNRDYIIDMLINLNNQGKTIIMVTHDETIINRLSKQFEVITLSD